MRSPLRHGSNGGALVVTSALAAALVFSFAPMTARAQQTPVPTTAPADNGAPVSLDMRDARLEEAVVALTKGSGLQNIVIVKDESGAPFNLVNVALHEQPLRIVLKAVAESAGAVLTYEDGIYYLRHRSNAPVKPTPQAPAPETTVVVPTAPQAPVKAVRKNLQMVRIPLNYMLPSDFTKMLDDPNYLEIAGQRTPEADVFSKATNYNPASSIINGAYPVAPAGAPNPSVAPAAAAGAAGAAAGSAGEGLGAGQRGNFGGGGGFGGQGGNGGFGGFGGGQGPGGPGGGGQNGQGSLRGLFPDITQIISNDATNDLLVLSDSIEDVDRLRQLIKLLDVAPKQVLVKAEFVAVNISDADSFGIDWHIQPAGNLDAQVPAEPGGISPTLTLAYASGNAVGNLRLSALRNTQNLLQAPVISTLNNRLAYIDFQRVISVAQTVNITTPTGVISNTVQVPIQASNGIAVTPHINGDNSITMSVSPTLQDVQTQTGGGFAITRQTLVTTRRIQSGETMVLGGFVTKNTLSSLRKVPILADLPIIGALFQQRDRTTTGSEVLVFITPTIIEDRAQGVIGTGGGQATPTP